MIGILKIYIWSGTQELSKRHPGESTDAWESMINAKPPFGLMFQDSKLEFSLPILILLQKECSFQLLVLELKYVTD